MRVAVVHDWLYTLGGAERVLKEILHCYPGADVFTLFDVLSDEQRLWLGYEKSHTSFLQKIPKIGKLHRSLLPLMPLAIEQFDFSEYDLIISSSYAVAKGVITGPDQLHISYVHSPMRYAWDLQQQYLRDSNGLFGLKRVLARPLLHMMRIWDTASGSRADALIANSAYISRRIRKTCGRAATVINTPVDVRLNSQPLPRRNHFLTAGRLVSYKNVQAVVDAFKLMPDQQLIVAGVGPDENKLRASAPPNVTFKGFVDDAEMRELMSTAQALIFASEEDFGIIPVEAQAEGTPVLALGLGGAKETVIADGDQPTGMFFDKPTAAAIAACVSAFIPQRTRFSREACHRQAKRFGIHRFRQQFVAAINLEIERAQTERRVTQPELRPERLNINRLALAASE